MFGKNYFKKIKNIVAKSFLILCFFSCAITFGCAQKSLNGLHHFSLDNGLSLFVVENHTVSLAYIEIAVKAGAVSQKAETAGLFHLYEHMMFKGNSLYPDAASFDRAMKDMGIASHNGSTGIDCVNYFFTIPSSELENGLAFWNAAVRTPLMRADEFENEKKVVLAEIEGRMANPGTIFSYYANNVLFPNDPYKLDPGGSVFSISNATISQMKEMQKTFYVPENTALFVGGDVNASEVFELVNKIYGNWQNDKNTKIEKSQKQNDAPFEKIKFAVMPFDQISRDLLQVNISFRGPDADFEIDDTYAADYFLKLCEEPQSILKQTLVQNENLNIPDVDYVNVSFATTRASGTIDFGATLLEPEKNITSRIDLLVSEIQNNIIPEVANEKSLYSRAKRAQIVQSLSDENILATQTATSFLSNVRFWWCCADEKYFYDYDKNMSCVSQSDMKNFFAKYFAEKNPLVTVLVNPSVYETVKTELANAGYETISSENAFWWNNKKFAEKTLQEIPQVEQSSKIEISKNDFVSDFEIEKKTDATNGIAKDDVKIDVSIKDNIKEFVLSNGIKVFVNQGAPAKVSSVYVVVKGGIENLSVETSGLENALFNMMAMSSKNYDYATRQNLFYEKKSAVSATSRVAGSALYFRCVDRYFYDMLDMLVDGMVSPSYEKTAYDLLMTDLQQGLQSMMNNPSSLLSYEKNKAIYKNHAYATTSYVVPESISQITIENMKSLHEKILSAENIFVVASGNIDTKKFVQRLNKTLGKIVPKVASKNRDDVSAENVAEVTVSGAPLVLTHPSVAGTGHVERVFKTPSPKSDEFAAAILAADIFSDVLYQVVREHYGACYTPYSYAGSSKAAVGGEFLYRVSDLKNFSTYMKEARKIMSDGNLIDFVKDDGSYAFVKIENRLHSYKNSFVNQTYESAQTVSDVAWNIAYNLLQYEDILYDEKLLEKIYNTTAEDVLSVFKKYWCDEPSRWFVVVGPENAGLQIRN